MSDTLGPYALGRKAWRFEARLCPYRVYDDVRGDGTGHRRARRGNPLCSLGCIGRRCVYGLEGCEVLDSPTARAVRGMVSS